MSFTNTSVPVIPLTRDGRWMLKEAAAKMLTEGGDVKAFNKLHKDTLWLVIKRWQTNLPLHHKFNFVYLCYDQNQIANRSLPIKKAEFTRWSDEIQCDWFQYSTSDGQIVSPIPLWLSYLRNLAHFIVQTYQVCIVQLWVYQLRKIHQKLEFSVIDFNILLVMSKLNHPQYQKITPILGMFKEWTWGYIFGKFCSIWPLM